MSNEEELAKYRMVLQQYQEQVNQLEMQAQYLQAALADYSKAKITLENLTKEDKDTETLIPIGGSAFVYAKVTDTSKVLVDIGAGLIAERSFEDGIKKLDERIDEIQKNQDKIYSMIEQFQAEAADITQKAQKLMTEGNE